MKLKYDVVIVGGGAAGISCAYNSSKLGLKTLLIEKNIHLGGLITSGLVIPVMKLESKGINTDFYKELTEESQRQNASIVYSDGNHGWFNTELLKSVFDLMLKKQGCDVLFRVPDFKVKHNNNKFKIFISSNELSLHIDTNYLVDGTGNGEIFRKLKLEFLKDKTENQSLSLRFILSGVDRKKFAEWISNIDKNRNVTTTCNIGSETHFSTAYTWDSGKKWALEPYFQDAVSKGILKESDSAYFQVFSVPCTTDSVAFNCPKLLPSDDFDKNSPFYTSNLIIEGRNRINRLTNFCRTYLSGFENAYISNIADMLGIRESARILGKYVFTTDDIISGKIPENIALSSNYPIDIHSDKKNKGELTFTQHQWYLPIEALISKDYDNLFAVGRCLSAEFKAHAAVRTQLNCFSMGEAVAKHIYKLNCKN